MTSSSEAGAVSEKTVVTFSEATKDALEAYATQPPDKIPDDLAQLLEVIAQTGAQSYPWEYVVVLLCAKFKEVATEFNEYKDDCLNELGETFEERIEHITSLFKDFNDTPFTIQRICELLVRPRQMYNSTRRWMNAVEKLVSVSSVTPGGDPMTVMSLEPYWENMPGDTEASAVSAVAPAVDGPGEAAPVFAARPDAEPMEL